MANTDIQTEPNAVQIDEKAADLTYHYPVLEHGDGLSAQKPGAKTKQVANVSDPHAGMRPLKGRRSCSLPCRIVISRDGARTRGCCTVSLDRYKGVPADQQFAS